MLFSVTRFQFFQVRVTERDPSRNALRISARGSDAAQTPQVSGDLTAGETPVPIPNTEVKPCWADCTVRDKCMGE